MDEFIFAEEEDVLPTSTAAPWKVLIVDDEPDVHNVTGLVLSGFELDNVPIKFFNAYSAKEAEPILIENPDMAVAFVDVVMESTHAGLNLVQFIRKELNNKKIRLVLRTGQPGEAPEETIIKDYDINDYKNKTELTASKLKTLMYSTLRSYRDILTIEKHKQGLEKIIAATNNFLDCNSMTEFASTILEQVAIVLGISHQEIMCCAVVTDAQKQVDFKLLAATGLEPDKVNMQSLPDHIKTLLTSAHNQKRSLHTDEHFVGFYLTNKGQENLLYVSHAAKLNNSDHDLLEFFTNNIAVVYDNIRMREVVESSQRELSYLLGEAVERRSKETGSHVKRVANFSYLLAKYYGLPEAECERIKLASPLHDVGKISIPDKILNKPGKLDEVEWEIMKTHAQVGFEILSKSHNELLQLGSIIAQQHHENFDGSGYPMQLKGQNIHIAGRITALADVFDALASDRCYKPAWPIDKVLDLIRQESGKKFEPKLVSILLDHLDEFIEIRDTYPDPS